MTSGGATGRLLATGLTHGDSTPRVVGGSGVWFEFEDGRRLIDASNTAAPLGHRHPEMVEAIRGAADAPVLNEGWGWREREDAAADLIDIAFGGEDWVGAVRFFISASEANDAALALAQALTGRTPLATRTRAYHGGAGLAREMTIQPHWHGGLASATGAQRVPPRSTEVLEIPAPTNARITGGVDPTAEPGWAADAAAKLARSAAVILDYSQGGVYHTPAYQDTVAALAREAGALWIADETVTGFGRTGGWLQFQKGESRPDIVTMGKCICAGAAPAGAMVLSRDLLAQLDGTSWQTYSTFRAHPIAVAAVRAHLRVSLRDDLFRVAAERDQGMVDRLTKVAADHPSVARVDGRGLHWTIELHGPDWHDWDGSEAAPLASRVSARAAEAGAMIATSGERTSLFVAPPLIASEAEIDLIVEALDHGLELADEEVGTGT
ncbi:MAG: aminotransferase class III-fold pyridoxal phosphate-dependent enzyme [Actinobacteria bacterium]|nr:aminotransferase class III-fold pyridoxal phosphate-dependent enzyme [Actinomycetota bacterium]